MLGSAVSDAHSSSELRAFALAARLYPRHRPGVLEVHVRAAGYHEDRHRRAADDLGRVRAKEDLRYGSEPAGPYHEHLTLFPQ
jgi:hypothetical protein